MRKAVVLTLVAGTLLLAGCCTDHKAGRWEYREAASINEVNQLAAQGWRVVGYSATDTDSGHYQHFLLKRAKQ